MKYESIDPIKQSTVVKTILNKLKHMFVNKVLVPGERLPSEREMAERFGVGKSSIREVIKMLDAIGIVESRQGHGTFICNTPKEDSLNPLVLQLMLLQGSDEQLLEFRKLFETAYTFMAMDTMTENDKKTIATLLIPTSAKADADFHRAILRSTHNPYVIRTGEILIDLHEITLSRTVPAYANNDPDAMPEDVQDFHRLIYEALCKKDKKGLREVLDKSYEIYGNTYMAMRNRPGNPVEIKDRL